MADVEAIGRLISLGLRSGIPIEAIHRQLRGISSDRITGLGPNKVMSVPDAIGIAIERWVQAQQGVQQDLLEQAEPVEFRGRHVKGYRPSRRAVPDASRRRGYVHGRVPGLRLAARVCGRVRQVSRVRVQRVRVIG